MLLPSFFPILTRLFISLKIKRNTILILLLDTRFIYHDPQNRLSRSWQRQLLSTTHQKPPENFYITCAFVFENVWAWKGSLISYIYIFWGFKKVHTHIFIYYVFFVWMGGNGEASKASWFEESCLRGQKPCFFVWHLFMSMNFFLKLNDIWRRIACIVKIDHTIKLVKNATSKNSLRQTWEIEHVTKWPEGEL